jgi:hypothetical protein
MRLTNLYRFLGCCHHSEEVGDRAGPDQCSPIPSHVVVCHMKRSVIAGQKLDRNEGSACGGRRSLLAASCTQGWSGIWCDAQVSSG